MNMWSTLVLVMVATATTTVLATYSETGECKEDTCVYDYAMTGGLHDQRAKEGARITAKITLKCESVGRFNDEDALRYCVESKEVMMQAYEIQRSDIGIEKEIKKGTPMDMTVKMGNRFCFIRNDNGKLLSVFHSPNDTTNIVNLKKTIASAFQANFDKTATTVKEVDSLSAHTSHYSYQQKGSHTIERRIISKRDVSKYAGKVRKNKVDHDSEQEIDIDENNVIYESRGTSKTSLSSENKREEKMAAPTDNKDNDIPPIQVKSKYTLKLVECRSTANVMSIDEDTASKWDYEPTMDDMMAKIDEREYDYDKMKELHDELPGLIETAKRVARDTSDDSNEHQNEALSKWRHLLHLESKHGPINGKTPKIQILLNELKKISSDESADHSKDLKLIIYNLLSSEGSISAQQALLNALKTQQMMDMEYDNIVMAISLLQSVDTVTIREYTQYVLMNIIRDEELLLSLATLGRHKNVEQEVVDTITQLIEEQGVNDTDTLIYFIHALGNTGSRLIIPHLTPLLLNTDIQVTVIDALRTVSTDKRVQVMFSDLCRSSSVSVDTVLAIIESVRFPHESFLYYPESPEEPEDDEVEKQLIMNIVNATIRIQDTRLFNATKMYLQATTTEFSSSLLNDLIVQYHNESSQRSKRSYTRDWSSTTSSIYNYIASSSTRSADKSNYRYHKAFLWGKQLGPSKVHAKFVAGGFAGVGRSGYKVYGKAFVQLYCFGKTYTALNGYYTNQYNLKTRAKEVRRYVNFLGRTYIDTSATTQARVRLPYQRTWSRNLGSRRLFYIRYRIFVYVGILKFYIRGDVTLDAALSINMKTIEAKSQIQFGPTFIVTGGVSLRILRYRVGIRVSARIGYYIKPMASVTMCDDIPKADVSACFGIFHGSNGLKVDVYAYYKKLRCRIRRWRLRCWWTGDYRVRRLSSTYNVGGVSNRLYWGQCFACSCRGLLHQYCSAHRGVPGTASRCYCRSTRFQ